MRIIVDAFGGDNAPYEIVKGSLNAKKEYGFDITLVGHEDKILSVVKANNLSLGDTEILHADDVILMEDEPTSIVKSKKNSSMAVGLRALSEGFGDAFVSAGSTGALLVGGTFIVKRIKGVSRPALAVLIPGKAKPFMLIDGGANMDARPEMLLQFAHMSSAYMTHVLGDGAPATLALLNVGSEESKGGELQLQAFKLLSESGLNFIGNIEARDVVLGVTDIVVADGFAGNVLLKTMEGVSSMLLGTLKEELMSSTRTKIGAAFAKPAFDSVKALLSTEKHGGAPLLGLNKPVIKAHGNSKANEIMHAIRIAAEYAKKNVTEQIEKALNSES